MPETNIRDSIGYIEDTLVIGQTGMVLRDSVTGDVIDKAKIATMISDSTDESLPKAIIVDIEATHSGLTKNITEYVADKMEKSAHTWTSPYHKPVLKEHRSGGDTLGRVKSYDFLEKSSINPERACIALSLEITDKDSIRRHLDGTALTYSIGGQAKEVYCSICGIDIINSDSWCGHWKGDKYKVKTGENTEETKTCVWQIGMMDYLEVSEVNIPADGYAQRLNVKVKAEDKLEGVKEDSAPVGDTANVNVADGLSAADLILTQDQKNIVPPVAEGTSTTDTSTPVIVKTVDQLQLELTAVSEQLVAVTAERDIAKDELATTKTSLTKATDDLTIATTEVQKVSDSAKQTFTASVEIAKTLKRVYADSIVESMIRTGDLAEDLKAAKITDLVVKSAKELSDTLDGLKVAEKARQVLPKVTPANVGDGALASHQDRVDVGEAKKLNDIKPVTADDAVNAIVNAK